MFELWVHDAWTGDEIARVDGYAAEAGTAWMTNLGGTGQCAWVFNAAPGLDGLNASRLAAWFLPNARILALRWGSTVVGAWKVEDWDYDNDRSVVTVSGAELRGETKWRMTYSLAAHETGTLAVTNRSHQGAVRAILARFMQWTPEWYYPIDLPADGAGSFSATWEYWRKFTIADLLSQIEDEGSEVFLRPYLTAGRQLRFQVHVAPRVQVGMSFFHLQAETTPLGSVHYQLSGANQITGGQGLGNGTGQDQQVRYAGYPPYSIPIRDVKRQFSDLVGDRLKASVDAWYAVDRYPASQWTVETFTASDEFPPAHAVTGRGWQLESKGHPVFPDGPHTLRVIAASGSWSNQIKTEVQGGS